MNYLFLLVVSVYALFIGNTFIKPHISKIWYRLFNLSLGLSIILFYLMDLFTLKPRPRGVSGNGNLGFIVLMFLIPIFLFWLGIWGRSVLKGFFQETQSNQKIHLMIGLFLLAMGTVLQIYFVSHKLKTLENHPYNPLHPEYIGLIINQYTNTLFFNGYTFGILESVVLIGTLLILKYKIGKQKN